MYRITHIQWLMTISMPHVWIRIIHRATDIGVVTNLIITIILIKTQKLHTALIKSSKVQRTANFSVVSVGAFSYAAINIGDDVVKTIGPTWIWSLGHNHSSRLRSYDSNRW